MDNDFKREVQFVSGEPIEALLDPAHLTSIERVRDGHTTTVPAFRLSGEEIWGATAMVLAEFLMLLGWKKDNNRGAR